MPAEPNAVTPWSLALRALRSPLGRIVAFFVMLHLIGLVTGRIYTGLGLPRGGIAFGDITPAIELFRLLPVVLAYWLLVRFVESRRVEELAARKALPHVLLGLAGGAILFSLVVGALWAMGAFVIDGVNHDEHWLGPILGLGVGAGVGEEIISRGVIFRIVEEGLGTWAALLLSAAVFGGLHAWNPNATVWSMLAIAIEAGLLFGLLYHVTRSLWICMGVHAAWNVAQGPVYGIPVSGFSQHGLIASHMRGPDWLTGGAFGAEASVVALGLCSMLTAACLAIAMSRGTLVPPFWRRNRAQRA
jgi:membrane protease YdiL (CAAX protease family)